MINNFNSHLGLKLIKKCPVCQSDYQQAMMQVLEESDYGILTYASCQGCGANLLTKFSVLPQGVIGNAILTDLKPQEVLDFAERKNLSADEVLDVQYLLDNQELINNLRKLI
jgi:hypothetical protein